MYIQIFRNKKEIALIKPLESSELRQVYNQDDYVALNFTLNDYIELQIGDYIALDFTDKLYRLNSLPEIVESPEEYNYSCRFESDFYDLKKYKVFLYTNKTEGGYYKDFKYSITGDAESLLRHIINSLENSGLSYEYGGSVDSNTITIEFNNWNIYESMQYIANELNINWYFNNNKLYFGNPTDQKAYTLQVGRGVGFIDLTQTSVRSNELVTVLYGYGNSKNMPPRYGADVTYDSSTLDKNRLSFVGVDGESKLTKNVDKYGIIEDVKEFENIFPQRIGVVTSLSSNINVIYDNTIDFNINEHLINDIEPKITFTSGKLSGQTFVFEYENSNKSLTLTPNIDETGSYPNEVIRADVYDSYIIFDIDMPQSDKEDAKNRLIDATQSLLNERSMTYSYYKGNLDQQFVINNTLELFIHDVIRIVSPIFNIDNYYSLKELTRNIANQNIYSIGFGEKIPRNLLNEINTQNFNITQSIYNVEKNSITTNQVVNISGGKLQWKSL